MSQPCLLSIIGKFSANGTTEQWQNGFMHEVEEREQTQKTYKRRAVSMERHHSKSVPTKRLLPLLHCQLPTANCHLLQAFSRLSHFPFPQLILSVLLLYYSINLKSEPPSPHHGIISVLTRLGSVPFFKTSKSAFDGSFPGFCGEGT